MSILKQMKPTDALHELMQERILLLDGSMGALIFSKKPQEADYRGERFRTHPVSLKNCTEALVLTQPKLIERHPPRLSRSGGGHHRDLHLQRQPAGAGGISASMTSCFEINDKAAELARRAADEFTRRNPGKPRFVAGSIGPTTKIALHGSRCTSDREAFSLLRRFRR